MERRFDPVTGEWRMFAGHRQDRTFLPPAEFCPLCPTREGQPPTEIPARTQPMTAEKVSRVSPT